MSPWYDKVNYIEKNQTQGTFFGKYIISAITDFISLCGEVCLLQYVGDTFIMLLACTYTAIVNNFLNNA